MRNDGRVTARTCLGGCGECALVRAAELAERPRGIAMDDPAGLERIRNQRNDDHCNQDQFDHKVFHEVPPNTFTILRAPELRKSDTATLLRKRAKGNHSGVGVGVVLWGRPPAVGHRLGRAMVLGLAATCGGAAFGTGDGAGASGHLRWGSLLDKRWCWG